MTSLYTPFFFLLAVLAGFAVTSQAPLNAQLRLWIGHPLYAAFLSFVVGTLALGVVSAIVALSGGPRFRLEALGQAPWWVWIGGFLGTFFVTTGIILAPRLGPALFFALIVAGQMACALLLEHLGLLGMDRHPLSAGRLAGAALIVAGVVLVRQF